ncbi:MAG: MFS transporter [Candidatus Symbiobacter sp.]|nr:MFS transporter [Candidatus Symbiobacter sp.]
MNSSSLSTLSTKSLLLYGVIAVPMAFAGFPLYVLAPDFYATNYGLTLTQLGTLLLAIRLFDAVQDPFFGWLTDRMGGKFTLLVAGAAGVICVSIFGLFNLVLFSPVLWFALCLYLAVSAYGLMAIVVGAQATLWTAHQTDQTRLAGMREALGLVGLVVAVSMPWLLSSFLRPDQVYVWYSLGLTLLMAVGIVSFSRVLSHSMARQRDRQKISRPFLSAFAALSRRQLILFAIYAVSMIASSFPAVLVIFYVRDLLAAEHLTGIFLLLYFLSGAAFMKVWTQLSGEFGKYQAWVLSNLLAVLGFIAAFFLGAGDVWQFALVCFVSGIALGGDLVLPPSILADEVHANKSEIYAATHYALLAFMAKAALALASAMALPVLDAAGFKPQTANSASALLALSTAYALIPCGLKLLAAMMIYFFSIRKQGRLR